MRLDTFTQAYIETALWSSTDNADETGGAPCAAGGGQTFSSLGRTAPCQK